MAYGGAPQVVELVEKLNACADSATQTALQFLVMMSMTS